MNEKIGQAADLLARLRLRKDGAEPPIRELPEAVRPTDMDEAYAIQAALNARLASALGPVRGWKIGLTSKVMQEYIGHPSPAAGALYERQIRTSPAKLVWADYRRLGLECEIAVRLKSDLKAGDDPLAAVGDAMCSVEVVEERFEDFKIASFASMVADDFFTQGVVLGEGRPVGELPDLRALRGGFHVDGAPPEAVGEGSAILGHPMNALGWLAELWGVVPAGAVVSLGSVVKTIYPPAGTHVKAEFEELGAVELEIV